MSFAFARRQRTGEDYFLAGRRMGGTTLALSILANQASAVSLVGARPSSPCARAAGCAGCSTSSPAAGDGAAHRAAAPRVALRAGSSIYAYAEKRYDRRVRRALAGAFLLSARTVARRRALRVRLVLGQTLGWTTITSLLVVGLFSVAYTSSAVGGRHLERRPAVRGPVGGHPRRGCVHPRARGTTRAGSDPAERSQALVLDATGFGDGGTFSFWPMLFGGIFLYSHTTAATRARRSAPGGAQRRGGEARAAAQRPAALPARAHVLRLRTAARGAAAHRRRVGARMAGAPPMRSCDFLVSYLRAAFADCSWLPSSRGDVVDRLGAQLLAAVTLETYSAVLRRGSRCGCRASRRWHGVGSAVLSGLAFARSGQTVIEMVNQVGSAFYGPVLACSCSACWHRR